MPFWPTKPDTDDRLTIAPPPLFSIAAIPCFNPRNTPFAFTSIRRSQADVLIVSGSNVPLMPALLTRMSSLPKRASAAATAASHAGSLATSRCTKWPAPPRLSATCLPSASSTSATTTFAPSRAKIVAVLCPMPLAAPVINATLPSSLMSSSSRQERARLARPPVPAPTAATRARSECRLRGGRRDGLDDAVIAGAPAQDRGEPVADLLRGQPGIRLQQVERGEQHARRAESALQPVVVVK